MIICDFEILQFNTAVARIMEIVNEMYKYDLNEIKNISLFKDTVCTLIKIIAPFMPHFAEEKWNRLGNNNSVFFEKYPIVDEKYLVKDEIEIAVQVNGVVRSRISVSMDNTNEEIENIAINDEKIKKFIGDKQIKKIIVIKQKIVNVVI